MKGFVARLWQEEQGQAVTEYVLLLVLVSLLAVSAVKTFASSLNNAYSCASADLVAYYTHIQTENHHRHQFRMKRSSAQFQEKKPPKERHKRKKESN